MKRRLLGQAVRENVLLIEGRRETRRRRWAVGRIGTFALLPIALVASSFVLANARAPRDPAPGLAISSTAAVPQRMREPQFDLEAVRYEAPRAVDRRVFPLAVQKIVLDPGHGGANSGTVTPSGLKEKNLALDIALRLRDLLEEASYEVVMTRDDDRAVSLEERVAIANEVGGDLFLSIHLNWISTRQVRGVETYYLGTTDDPYLNELASSENRDSGYSLIDFRRLLEGLWGEVRQDESRDLAQSMQHALFRSLRKVNPRVQNRGVKTAPFVVLIGTEMPAVLAEVSCLSNREEADLLTKTRYRQYIAESLASGLRSFADARNQIAVKGPDTRGSNP